ncbi:uncharacterized protein LOC129858157 [Salvelinus fontinalis]|uniref:uncharacterized protein LOC129858157 n=1 Tax=Salvelinus fontinalis TaxID=8038 RepID=UPI002485AE55|nr:uncharacterized protein LOC129858157 [Salvelinus fontinalis]
MYTALISRTGLTNPPVIQSTKRELAQASKGSSAVINYMHHFFTNYGVEKTRVDLNCDNCSGQNKNKFVLWYCAWWTMYKLHHNWDFHFLITGHTTFATDLCFSLIKQRFRQTRVNTLSEIAGVVKDSTVTGVNIPELVGLDDGTVLVESYGWQQHLTPYFRPLARTSSTSTSALMLWSLVLSLRSVQTVKTRFQLLRNADILPPIDGLPVKAPPGLDTARQHIFDKIREFCDKEAMDITCPAPKGRTETGSPNIDSLVHAWFGRSSHQHYLQCLYSNDSLLTHTLLLFFGVILLLSHFTPDYMYS